MATNITNTSIATDNLEASTNLAVGNTNPGSYLLKVGPVNQTETIAVQSAGGGAETIMQSYQGTDSRIGSSANTPLNFLTNNVSRMTLNTDGHLTIPNQPSWNLRPNSGSSVTMGQSDEIIGWTNASNTGGNAFLNGGVTLSASNSGTMNANSSGRINLPIAGKYKVWCTIRCENTPGTGNIYLSKNGTTIARQHVEVWARYNYGHGFLSLVLDCAANDYLEWRVARANGIVSGYSDTVNWAGGFLIG